MRKEDTSATDIKETINENKGNSWAKDTEEQTNKCNNNLNKSNVKGSPLFHIIHTSADEECCQEDNKNLFHDKSDEENKEKCEYDKSINDDLINNYRSSMIGISDRTSKASDRKKSLDRGKCTLQKIESGVGIESESDTNSPDESDDAYSLVRFISEIVEKYKAPIVPINIETKDFRQAE